MSEFQHERGLLRISCTGISTVYCIQYPEVRGQLEMLRMKLQLGSED